MPGPLLSSTLTRSRRPCQWRRLCAVLSLGAASLLGAAAVAQPVRLPSPLPLVQELLRRGQADVALRAADDELTRQPRNAELRFLRAVALMDLQRNSEAAQAFTALAEEYPELPDPWNNLALLHVRAGQPELARQALETALRNDPTHRTARLNLGEVYLMLAAQSWETAARLSVLEPAWTRRLQAVRDLLGTPLSGR